MKVADAELELVSVAVTAYDPGAEEGTVNEVPNGIVPK